MGKDVVLFIVFSVLAVSVIGRKGFGPGDQEWGHVTVREGVRLFWWLHKTTAADVGNYTERPLVVWLHNEPFGYGGVVQSSLQEIGPLDEDLRPRNASWVAEVNVLFVDHLATKGDSWSHLEEHGTLAATPAEVAGDVAGLLKGVFGKLPELEAVPMYIFGEGAGGRFAPQVALSVHQACKSGSMRANLKGVALGNPWVSPGDAFVSWAPYMLNAGEIDTSEYERFQRVAQVVKRAIDEKNYTAAVQILKDSERDAKQFYTPERSNILYKVKSEKEGRYSPEAFANPRKKSNRSLSEIDAQITRVLELPQRTSTTFSDLIGAIVQFVVNELEVLLANIVEPETGTVEQLLTSTDLEVTVYVGTLDFAVNVPGTLAWIDRLKFKGATEWKTAVKEHFAPNGYIEGFVKKADKFTFYAVSRAGRMAPADNPEAMLYILRQVTGLSQQQS